MGDAALVSAWLKVAAVVGAVEAGSFEDYTPSAADESAELRLAALWALASRRLGHGLEQFVLVLAAIATIVVSRHVWASKVRR